MTSQANETLLPTIFNPSTNLSDIFIVATVADDAGVTRSNERSLFMKSTNVEVDDSSVLLPTLKASSLHPSAALLIDKSAPSS